MQDYRRSAARGRSATAILACAFSGELVPQDPADEPAEALLARIRTERPRERTVQSVTEARDSDLMA